MRSPRRHETGAAASRGHETGVARPCGVVQVRGGSPVRQASLAASCPRKLIALVTLACVATAAEGAVVFRPVDLMITGDAPLAAWQVEVRYDRSKVKILSLEGGEAGEDKAWREPPHYDRRGMSRGRIVLAAFVDDDAKDYNVAADRWGVWAGRSAFMKQARGALTSLSSPQADQGAVLIHYTDGLDSLDPFSAVHVGAERFGVGHGAVGVLVELQQWDQDSG